MGSGVGGGIGLSPPQDAHSHHHLLLKMLPAHPFPVNGLSWQGLPKLTRGEFGLQFQYSKMLKHNHGELLKCTAVKLGEGCSMIERCFVSLRDSIPLFNYKNSMRTHPT